MLQKFYYGFTIENGSEGTNVKIQKLIKKYYGNSDNKWLWFKAV